MKDNGEKGFSAARAGKVQKRTKPTRKIAEPATYDIKDGGKVHEKLPLREVCVLCPTVNVSTLQRRLQSGERNLVNLRKPPQPNIGRLRAKHVKPRVK